MHLYCAYECMHVFLIFIQLNIRFDASSLSGAQLSHSSMELLVFKTSTACDCEKGDGGSEGHQ